MPRPPRVDYPGAWHHVWHRGTRRAPIFESDEHCYAFLDLIDIATSSLALEVHAYALMSNHYHLLVRTPQGNLSECMQFIDGRYTQEMNRLNGWDGSLFRGRFKSALVEDEAYLIELSTYIHLNPVRKKLVRAPDKAFWTSYQAYVGLVSPPEWLITATLLDQFGGVKAMQDHVQGRHRKKSSWPVFIDPDSGRIRKVDGGTAGLDGEGRKHDIPLQDPDFIIEQVCEVTGSSLRELRTARRGRGANPSRRFAVLALLSFCGLKQREVGEILKMSPAQVAKVLERNKINQNPTFREWMDALKEKCQE